MDHHSSFVHVAGHHQNVHICVMQNRLRELREIKGWSQLKLSARSEVTQPTIAMIESGKRKAHIDTAMKLAKALGVTVDQIFSDGTRDESIEKIDQIYREATPDQRAQIITILESFRKS